MQYHSLLIHVSNALLDQTKQLLEKISPYLSMQYTPNNPDFHTLLHRNLEKNSIGIDDVRSLTALLWQKPFRGDCTVAVIADATVLTPEAQQSLLKILEEPPEHAQIVLLATHPNTLLPTILSRCRYIKLEEKNNLSSTQTADLPCARELSSVLSSIQNGNIKPSDAIELAQTIGASKENAITCCDTLLLALHHELETNPTKKVATAATAVIKARQRLQKNVSPKLAIESMLFRLLHEEKIVNT